MKRALILLALMLFVPRLALAATHCPPGEAVVSSIGPPNGCASFAVQPTSSVDVSAFGASGLDTTATCTTVAGSHELTSCSGALLADIKVGNYVEMAGPVGYASPLTNLTTFIATVQGGDTSGPSYTYDICTVDPSRGVTGACAEQVVANGPTTLRIPTDIALTFTNPNSGINSAIYIVYRKIGSGAFQFIQTLNVGQMVDIGGVAPDSHGWPTSPPAAAARQYFWSKVTNISGNSIVVEDAVPANGAGVTIKHDDTQAQQAALDSGSVLGSLTTWGPGIFNTDRPSYWDLFVVPPVRYQRFDASMGVAINHLFGLGMLQLHSNSNLQFAGRNVTYLRTSFEGNQSGQTGAFGMNTGLYENPFFLDPAPTRYPLNNGAPGDTLVVATTAANAANFVAGDKVIIAGGAFDPTPYVANSIRDVVSADSTTGNIVLDQPLVKPLPMGTPGTAPSIFKITGQVVSNVQISDVTIQNYTSLFQNTSAVDHLHLARVDFPWGWNTDLSHTFFMRDWTMDNCNVQSAQNEVDLEDDFRFSYGTWTTVGGGISADEGTANFQVTHSTINLSQRICPGGQTCNVNSTAALGAALDTYNNLFDSDYITSTPNQGELGNTSAISFQGNILAGYTPALFKVHNSTIVSPASKLMFSANSPVIGLELTDSTIDQTSPSGAIQTLSTHGGLFANNDITVRGTGASSNVIMLAVPDLTTPIPFQYVNNHIKNVGTQSYTGLFVSDPGAPFDAAILAQANTFENLLLGVDVISLTNTPNYSVPIGTNNFNTVGTAYTPSGLGNFVAQPGSQGVGYAIATNTGSYIGASTGNGFSRFNFTSSPSPDTLFTDNIATISYNLVKPGTLDDATQPEFAHTFQSYINGFYGEAINIAAANGAFVGSPWGFDAKYDGTNIFSTFGGSAYATGAASTTLAGGTAPASALLTLNGGTATNFGSKGYIEVTPSSGTSTVPILEANGDTSFKRPAAGVFQAVNFIAVTPVALGANTCTINGQLGRQTNSTAACSSGATATFAGTTSCFIGCNGTNWIQFGF